MSCVTHTACETRVVGPVYLWRVLHQLRHYRGVLIRREARGGRALHLLLSSAGSLQLLCNKMALAGPEEAREPWAALEAAGIARGDQFPGRNV